MCVEHLLAATAATIVFAIDSNCPAESDYSSPSQQRKEGSRSKPCYIRVCELVMLALPKRTQKKKVPKKEPAALSPIGCLSYKRRDSLQTCWWSGGRGPL